jgi:hypothetical protein
VSQSVVEKEVMEREISPLLSIKDAYPKYLFTMDNMPMDTRGIIHKYIPEWLLEEN